METDRSTVLESNSDNNVDTSVENDENENTESEELSDRNLEYAISTFRSHRFDSSSQSPVQTETEQSAVLESNSDNNVDTSVENDENENTESEEISAGNLEDSISQTPVQMETEQSGVSESNSDNNADTSVENDENENTEAEESSGSSNNAEPNIEHGSHKKVYEDSELTVSYSRIGFRRLKIFHLTDYHFNLKIGIKNKGEKLLVVSAMTGILQGMRGIFEDLKQQFRRNLNREIYIWLVHEDLNPGIRIGPCNFKRDSVSEIVQKCQEKIDRVLESHASLSANKSLNFYIIVYGNFKCTKSSKCFVSTIISNLGKEHMEAIERKHNYATRISLVPTRGKSALNCKDPEYIIRIPDDFPGFQGLCLPLAILLVSKISFNFIYFQD